MAGELEELCQFLTPSARLDLRSTALDYVLGLTGSKDGVKLLRNNARVLQQLLELAADTSHPLLCRDAHLAVLNASADAALTESIITLGAVPRMLQLAADPEWKEADKLCMTLSNITRTEAGSVAVLRALTEETASVTLYQLVDIFGRIGYNKNANYDYLATVFSNISQLHTARLLFLDREKCIIPRLLPYTQSESLTRRGGVVGLLRNLCFQVDCHQWLLGEDVDILPSLLLPLAGPEEFSEEETDKLPEDLQYLPTDKTREGDPDIRKMLLEALTKLCSTQAGRSHMQDKQVYIILRALDHWETEQAVKQCCLDLISILISDEPDPGMQDLDRVDVPPEISEQLDRDREAGTGGTCTAAQTSTASLITHKTDI
jgi:hypothetical protein